MAPYEHRCRLPSYGNLRQAPALISRMSRAASSLIETEGYHNKGITLNAFQTDARREILTSGLTPDAKLFAKPASKKVPSVGKENIVMPKLSRVAPELPVSNLQSSIDYYKQRLGFKLAIHTPERNYAIVERDDIAIHLFHDDTQNHTPVGIHIFTSDIETLYSELQERGANISQGIVRQPWGNRDFRINDDSGNQLKFTEPSGSRPSEAHQ